jgi:hypothetical protein
LGEKLGGRLGEKLGERLFEWLFEMWYEREVERLGWCMGERFCEINIIHLQLPSPIIPNLKVFGLFIVLY